MFTVIVLSVAPLPLLDSLGFNCYQYCIVPNLTLLVYLIAALIVRVLTEIQPFSTYSFVIYPYTHRQRATFMLPQSEP